MYPNFVFIQIFLKLFDWIDFIYSYLLNNEKNV